MKVVSKSINADRFNTSGYPVETVRMSAQRIGSNVYLTIEGEKVDKNYVLSYSAWKLLEQMVEGE